MPAAMTGRLLALKAESTRGTYNTPVSADADIKFEDVKVEIEVGSERIKYQGNNMSFDQSVMTRSKVTINATTYLKGSGAAGTAPAERKLWLMAGCKETVSASTSVTYNRDKSMNCGGSYSAIVADEICDAGTLKQDQLPIAGLICNNLEATNVGGGVLKVTVELIGKLNENPTTETSLIVYTGFDTTVPPGHVGNAITYDSVVQRTDGFTFKLENSADLEINDGDSSGSGYLAAYLSDSVATIEITPVKMLVSEEATIADWRSGTVASFSSANGVVAGNIITFNAAAAQRETVGDGELNGIFTRPTTCLCTGDPSFTVVYT